MPEKRNKNDRARHTDREYMNALESGVHTINEYGNWSVANCMFRKYSLDAIAKDLSEECGEKITIRVVGGHVRKTISGGSVKDDPIVIAEIER